MGKRRNGRGGMREGAGRPLKSRIYATVAQEGLSSTWTRATFIVRKNHLKGLKALALKQRRRLKEVLDEILANAL